MKLHPILQRAALLAINLLFLMVWGFASLSKVSSGIPAWFGEKFGRTFLVTFPGLAAAFWILTVSELLAFVFAAMALLRGEFIRQRPPVWLTTMLVWSLFVFLQLGFGQWLTADYNSAFQLFVYFGVTLVVLHFVGDVSS
jgi:hypothetical protein